MRLTWLTTASVITAAVTGVGLAAPAFATDDITQNAVGTYEVHFKQWSAWNVWVANPCDDGTEQCVQVTEYSPTDTAHTNPRWTEKALWSVGSWIVAAPVDSQEKTCKDGTKYAVRYSYSWNAATNSGWRSIFDPGLCPDSKPATYAYEFNLIKIAPSL